MPQNSCLYGRLGALVALLVLGLALVPSRAMAQQPANPDPEPARNEGTQLSLNLDYLEWRSGEGAASLFVDATATAARNANSFVAKLSSDVPLSSAFAGLETQIRYMRQVSSAINLIAGLRTDIAPNATDFYPYLGINISPSSVLSTEMLFFRLEDGKIAGRAEAVASLPVSGPFSVEGKVELNWAGMTSRFGPAGLGNLEASSRLLVEASDRAQLYAGIVHAQLLGHTARLARQDGDATAITSLVLGARLQL